MGLVWLLFPWTNEHNDALERVSDLLKYRDWKGERQGLSDFGDL